MQKEKYSIKLPVRESQNGVLALDAIETSIVPLTHWHLRGLDEERKLFSLLRMSRMRLMEIQEMVKMVLESARRTFYSHPDHSHARSLSQTALKPPRTTGEECPICRLCFGYLEIFG